MTTDEFTVLARELIRPNLAFRARPGPRALRRRPNCVVVCVDLSSPTAAQDMRDGANRAEARA